MVLLDKLAEKIHRTAARVRMNNEVLEVARSNYLASPRSMGALPPFGIRWGQLRVELDETIRKFRSSFEAIEFGQTRGIYDHRERLTPESIPKLLIAQHLLRYEY